MWSADVTLQSRNVLCAPGPGAGSIEDRHRERAHESLLPPLQCEGPQQRPCRPRADAGIAHHLHTALTDMVATGVIMDNLEADIRQMTALSAISWTKWRRTLLFSRILLMRTTPSSLTLTWPSSGHTSAP